MISFIQPFGIQAPGGGSRILRGLLQGPHPPAISINTGLDKVVRTTLVPEVQIPSRPRLGRLERTRLHSKLAMLDWLMSQRFEGRLERVVASNGIRCLHLIPHSFDFIAATRVARRRRLPYFLSVHDDLAYITAGAPFQKKALSALGNAWSDASGVFVISEEMGNEYCHRYGRRPYQVITDGLQKIEAAPRVRGHDTLRIYFMGLFLHGYSSNLLAVIEALQLVKANNPSWEVSLTCRCHKLPFDLSACSIPVKVLPFGSETDVEEDMKSADVLYQPLSFEAHTASFNRFSLSTKMVTYLGSGLPIFYHGPTVTAAGQLLGTHRAGVVCSSLDSAVIASQLVNASANQLETVQNALDLAHRRFMLVDQQRKFWDSVSVTL